MATDPYNLATDDIRKRMEQLQQRGALARSAPPPEIPEPTAPGEPASRARPRPQFMDQTPASTDLASDRQRAGLTRIVRQTDANGNSVYTDAPAARGEERYYGALGNRADANFDPRTGRDVAVDLNTAAGQRQTFDNAQQQRRGLGRMLTDNQARAQGTDPANPRGLAWVQTPNGPRVMSAAERGGQGGDLSDRVALLRLQREIDRDRVTDARNATADERAAAQVDLSRRGLERQETADMRKFARENPEAFLREELGRLRGASPEELDAFFQTDQGRFVQSALDDSLGRTYADRAPALGGGMLADRPANFGDLQEAPWWSGTIGDLFGGQRYVTPNDTFQRGVTLEDLGLAENDSWLLDYFARRNARGR